VNRLLLFSFLLLAACSNRTSIPGDIIPPDSMQQILKEIIMAGQYSEIYIANDSTRTDKRKANQELLEEIFRIHHTTRDEVKKSLSFYESRPDLNKKIFDSLTADANRRKTEMYLPRPVKTGKLPEK
jgi:hypothetical protein